MAEINYGSIATEIGLIKLSNASLLNKPINITQIKLGDSNGIEYTPDGSETDLKNIVYTGLPNSMTPEPDNPDQFAAIELVVPSDTESFYVREMGAYDDEGDLIYIAAIAPRFKPQASAQSVDMSFELMVKILNADNVTIKVDTSKAIATQTFVNQEIDNHKTDPDAHSQYLKAEDLQSATEDSAGIAKIATKQVAESGANDTDIMTPLKTKQSIDKNVPDADEDTKGKAQKATDSEVSGGIENTKFITSKQLDDKVKNQVIETPIYAGSSVNNTSFPIGTTIGVDVNGVDHPRNLHTTISLGSATHRFDFGSGSTNLLGTYAMRGITYGSGYVAQRIY